MAIDFKTEPLPEYSKDEYFKKIIPLILDTAPEFDSFLLRKLSGKMNLSKSEKLIFTRIDIDIKNHLEDNGFVKMDSQTRKLTLTEKGRNKKNGIENNSRINITNSNISQVFQESGLRKTENNTPIKKSLIYKTEVESQI